MIIKSNCIEGYDVIDENSEVVQVIYKQYALGIKTRYYTLTQEILDQINKYGVYDVSQESHRQQKKESC